MENLIKTMIKRILAVRDRLKKDTTDLNALINGRKRKFKAVNFIYVSKYLFSKTNCFFETSKLFF
jgi:hypothetical protein